MATYRGVVFGPVNGLIWRLAGCYDEESPKALRKQNAENALFGPVHGSIDRRHPFPDHHHLRAFMGGDGDGIVGRVQREEFDAIVLRGVVSDGLVRTVFFHGEAAAIFRVAHPASRCYAVASSGIAALRRGEFRS